MEGYIYLHKKLLEWEWYHEPNTLRLFLHILLKANYTDKMHMGILIKRGTFMTSSIKLAAELDLSRQQIRTALSNLQTTNEITITSTNKYSVISVMKYSEYQFKENKSTNKITNKNSQMQPSNNHQITTTNKKNKEQLKELKEKDTVPYKEIISYLNEKANTKYRHTTQKTKDLIKARHNDQFNIDDFKTVIDKKCAEWLKTDMERYLRPETLFGTKFESYLNQTINKSKGKNDIPEDVEVDWFEKYKHEKGVS